MTISIAEYCARVHRLRLVLPDLESSFNPDEGLTLSWRQDGRHCVLTGEPSIVEKLEVIARTKLITAANAFDQPVSYSPFPTKS